MTLCGLWHGAGWTFVLVGLLSRSADLRHAHHSLRTRAESSEDKSRCNIDRPMDLVRDHEAVRRGLYVRLVSLGWILFRADHIEQALQLIAKALQPWQRTAERSVALFTLKQWG